MLLCYNKRVELGAERITNLPSFSYFFGEFLLPLACSRTTITGSARDDDCRRLMVRTTR